MANNFCYVKIGRFLSWLKGVKIKNLLGMALVLFVNQEMGSRFLLVVRIGLLLLLLFFPLRRPFFKFGAKRVQVILVLTSSTTVSKLMLNKECNGWNKETFIRSSRKSFCIKQKDRKLSL